MDLLLSTTVEEIAIAEQLYPDSPVEIDKIIPEVVHRYFAASLGLLAIFLVFIAFRKTNLKNIIIAIVCNNLPRIFGYLTVSLKLHP